MTRTRRRPGLERRSCSLRPGGLGFVLRYHRPPGPRYTWPNQRLIGHSGPTSEMDSKRGIPGYSGFMPNDCDNPGIVPPASSPYRVAVSRVGFRSLRGMLACCNGHCRYLPNASEQTSPQRKSREAWHGQDSSFSVALARTIHFCPR